MFKFIVSYSALNVFSLMMTPETDKQGRIDFKATIEKMRAEVGSDAIVYLDGMLVR